MWFYGVEQDQLRGWRTLAYAAGMWDVLTWHDGTLAIAWWAVIVLVVALLSIGGERLRAGIKQA